MRRVAITGATGFIGGRLAEILVDEGIEVVALVRRWGGASRLSRLPVRMVGGDILDPASLRAAFEGCDTVFHCAVDFRSSGRAHRRTTALGTRNVLQATLEAGANRLVHLSTAAVHGLSPAPGADVSEAAPLRRRGHDYADGKVAAEREVQAFRARHGLPVVILRPTVVYGPFGSYSAGPARVAREGRLALVDGAQGICNALYVDNLVQAMLLAAEREEAVGEVFTISDARTTTWRDYLERHAAALDPPVGPLPERSREALREAWRTLRRDALRRLPSAALGGPVRLLRDPAFRQGIFSIPGVPWAAGAAKTVLRALPERARTGVREAMARAKSGEGRPGSPAAGGGRVLAPHEVESFSVFEHVTFSIEKARHVLGYEPAIDLDEGMRRTAAWLRWARI